MTLATTTITDPQRSLILDLADQLEREIAPGSLEGLPRFEASSMISDMIAKVRSLPKPVSAAPKAEAVPLMNPGFDNPVIGKGYFTVTDDEGHRTFRVTPDQKWCDGKTTISVLAGPSNEFSYNGVGFVTNTGVQMWAKYRSDSRMASLIERLVADAAGALQLTLEMAKQHVLTSENCFVCGRLLTDPTSIEMGIGPICRAA